jgi:2-iminobutanoate/2-iminopropanoate deaminase
MKERISTPSAPQAIGPYSQAVRAGGFIFISGQVCFDPATGKLVEGDVKAQAEQVMKNLSAILSAAGSSWEKAVKCTVFLKDMNDFAAMNEVYGRFVAAEGMMPPARSTVEAARLPRDVKVEIDVIALA